jgi:hypothetical protein
VDADDFITLSVHRELAPSGDLAGFLSAFADALREGGCTLVGHIKGMLEGEGSPALFFSLTSLDGEPRFKGGPLRPSSGLRLSMNVIVAGIDEKTAGVMLESALAQHFHILP